MPVPGNMSADSDGSVELVDVAKAYGSQVVLEHASVSIAPGSFVVVLGRSGSGKSTLLRLIGGLESPDSGVVRIGRNEFGSLPESARASLRRTVIGFVFQFFNLIPTLTVAENVELPLALNRVPRAEARKQTLELLANLDVASCADRFPEELSGGEQQRVAIARAVIHQPKLVLADEPTGNLDLETARHVLGLLQSTCRERGATLLMATHSREVGALANRVLSIRNARIEEGAA